MSRAPDAIRARTIELIAEQTNAGYENGKTLGERNFDSLDIVELMIAIEGEFHTTLPDFPWVQDTAVDQVLADVVRAVCGAPE